MTSYEPIRRNMNQKIFRPAEVVSLTGLSLSTIKRLEQRGEFPRRIKLSLKAIGWKSVDIQNWIESKKGEAANV